MGDYDRCSGWTCTPITDTPSTAKQSAAVGFADHDGVMRAKRLVQRSAPQRLELVVVQGVMRLCDLLSVGSRLCLYR
jgi:hypothetical protein